MPTIRKITLLLFISGLISFAFLPETLNSRPQENFDWLKKYDFLYETVTPGHWEKNPQMRFDPQGIVTVNGTNYNPVTISQYALRCFDEFRVTGNERYKKAFEAQVKWLLEDSVYIEKNGMIYYPYRFAFHDLQPGWLSGLAQGEVVAVMIRYYYLTRKPEILEFIRKVCNHMITEVKDGGCLLKTPEGGWWIEEYVNSKQHRHVLNGNMVSIFCLYEYVHLFPDDKRANELYPQLLESLKRSVDMYDAGNGLRYDRGGGNVVAPWYMKAQVIETRSLYRITGDIFFHRKMMHWMTYCYNKSVGMIECIINDYNFSTPMSFDKSGNLVMPCESEFILSSQNTSVQLFPDLKRSNATSLFDKNPLTMVQFQMADSIKGSPRIDVWMTKTDTVNQLKLMFRNGKNPEVERLYSIDANDNKKKIKFTKALSNDESITYYNFSLMPLSGISVEFVRPDSGVFGVSELNLTNSGLKTCSEYIYYISKPASCDSSVFTIKGSVDNADEYAVYIRNAKSPAEVQTKAWIFMDEKFPASAILRSGSFQVMIVAKPKSPQNFRIKNLTSVPAFQR